MYFGSVRFFKHMILLVVIILITVPTVLACVGFSRLADADRLNAQLMLQLSEKEATATLLSVETGPSVSGEAQSYQEKYPDFYASEHGAATDADSSTLYLTFDDGPSNRTPEILAILREKNVKATFFVVGQQSEQALQWMRDIVAEGHTIGMHTYTHQYKTIYSSVDAYLDDMYQIFTQVREATGVPPTVFRLPGGSINSYNHGVYQEIIAEMLRRGFVPHDWNIASADASSSPISASQIIANVVSGAMGKNRGVVLMHDSEYKYSTVSALPAVIDHLLEMGYTLDAIQPETQPILFSYPD